MENRRKLFFDLDDTLVKCSGYFYEVEDVVAKKFREYTDCYTEQEWKQLFNKQQWENVMEHGYGPDNFKYSLMQVGSQNIGYDFFKNGLINFIEKESRCLYDSPLELIDGVEETVKFLYEQGYQMTIVTKGEETVQKDRFERLSIKQYFDGYEIVKHKEKKDYIKILKKHQIQPEDCYMIGNSPKGDINEAKLAGIHTIYIPNEHTWGYEEEQILNIGPETKILSCINEMKNIFI